MSKELQKKIKLKSRQVYETKSYYSGAKANIFEI